jgi:polyhydroxyalkanoate synthesis regulator phasin
MPEDVNNAAAPSSAVAIADGWDEHGTPIVTQKPEPPKKEEPAASDPPKVAKPEDKSAEPGAAKQEHKPKAKPAAEERISQLTAERKAAEDRANALEERLRKLESAAQPTTKAEPAKAKEPPKRPNPFTWTGTQEAFDKAMDEYETYRDQIAVARVRQEQAQSEAQKSMSEMLKQATAKHPDAAEKIKSATTDIMGKAPLFVQSFVNDSEVLGELLYTLADQTTLSNLLETAKTNPGKALRVLRDMELDIQKALSKAPEAKPEEKAPEPKPRAPKPPSEVGGRGAATEDAATAAARDGNFAAFEAEQRRRHFVAR